MSQPHAEPPTADVRSFLPRPGEPVEDYAARLRALHHDLTLVLDAVERGLAAAERSPEPAPVREAAAVGDRRGAEEPHRSPPPPGPLTTTRGSARVEVVSAPETAGGGGPGGERPWSGPPEPEGSAPWGGRPASRGEGGAPGRGEPAAPSPGRSQWDEPWVERTTPWQEPPPWTERRPSTWPPAPLPAEYEFEPPAHAPFAAPPRRRQPVPPLLIAALILGWLTVIALGLALAFGLG